MNRIGLRLADDAVQMLFDMNQELVESEYIVPLLADLVRKVKAAQGPEFIVRFTKMMQLSFMVVVYEEGARLYLDDAGTEYQRVMLLARLYGERIPTNFIANKEYNKLDQKSLSVFMEERRAKVPDRNNPRNLYSRIQLSPSGDGFVRTPTGVPHPSKTATIAVDTAWLTGTGMGRFCLDTAAAVISLQTFGTRKRRKKIETIDQMFDLE